MPLVTYTEGMPEFLEHQDTLCIRRRGTKLSNIGNLNNQEVRKQLIESTRKQQHWKQSSSQEDITFKLAFEAKLIAITRLRKQQSNIETLKTHQTIAPSLQHWQPEEPIREYCFTNIV